MEVYEYSDTVINNPIYPGGGKLTHLSFFAKIKKVFKYFPYTMTKSIFRPTSSHWISTFYSSLENLYEKQPDCKFFLAQFLLNN